MGKKKSRAKTIPKAKRTLPRRSIPISIPIRPQIQRPVVRRPPIRQFQIQQQPKQTHRVFVYGDSHTSIFGKMKQIYAQYLGGTSYPVTMYRFGKEGLDLVKCLEEVKTGHPTVIPKEGDIVLYTFGTNDAYGNHKKQQELRQITTDQFVDELVGPYIQQILHNQQTFKVRSAVYSLIPPPTRREEVDVIARLNAAIEKESSAKQLPFFNLYAQIVGPDSTVRDKTLVAENDFMHIRPDKSAVVERWFRIFLEKNFAN